VIRNVRDPYLPDHESFVNAEPSTGRIIVIAPTRAACETIELAVQLHIETYLERHHGPRVRELARSGKGFGIVAGTGTGKTLAIRPIAEEILPTTELQPDTRHRFRVHDERPITEARLDIHPDGGMARVRLFGKLTPDGLRDIRAAWNRSA